MICFRKISWIVDVAFVPVSGDNFVNHTWVCGDDVHVELAPETFLNNFQVQQPQKSATKTKAKRCRAFGLIKKAVIVELQLGQVALEMFIVGRVDWVMPLKTIGLIS